MSTPPPSPAERLATMLWCLAHAVAGRGVQGLLAGTLVNLILDRIREIKQRVARIAALLQSGRYLPRRATRRHPPARRRPRRPNPLPQNLGWLQKLLPEAVQYRGQLEHLLRQEDMAALLATAPAPLLRSMRSLCRMLGVAPPPILALPRPTPPQPAPQAAPQALPLPAPPSPPLPSHHAPRASAPPPPACGPPLPA